MYNLNLDTESQSSNIQKDAVGLTIELTIYEFNRAKDVSTASEKKFIFKKPNGTIIERIVSFSTDGVDGKLKYDTVQGDLDLSGRWYVQAFVTMGTFKGKSTVASFYVNDNL